MIRIDWTFDLSLMFVGLLIVFVVLCLLIFLVWAFGKIMTSITNRKEQKKKESAKQLKEQNTPAPAPTAAPSAAPAVERGISGEVVAAISAAVAMMSAGTDKQVKIRSIKRVKEARPAWNMAGITENTRPF